MATRAQARGPRPIRPASSRSSTRIVQLGLQEQPGLHRHAGESVRTLRQIGECLRGGLDFVAAFWVCCDGGDCGTRRRSKYMSVVARRQVGKMRRIMAAERARQQEDR